jgi:uncharacterized protein (DUF2235 family)
MGRGFVGKNIVICCDGTGNEIEENQTNVLKLYRVLKKDSSQIVYYDPGLGTLGADSEWGRIKQGAEQVAGLALGAGLDRNVLSAYEFIVNHYKDGDSLYLFGFSRGAYIVRVLAGFINSVGLLRTTEVNLAGYAFVGYKKIVENAGFEAVRLITQALRTERPPIRFLGLWDTVSSIIVPRRDRMYLPSMRQLAYTATNPSIESVRHAVAIDERRRMFRAYLWQEEQQYFGGPFDNGTAVAQDVKQVWFPGVHADIGGGYAEAESGLSKLTLEWMIDESPDGLKFSTQSVNQIVKGRKRQGSTHRYAAPDPLATMHESLDGGWHIPEWLPKRTKHREDPGRNSFLGIYLPRGEPRGIPADSSIHRSVEIRMNADPSYRPPNLP